MSRRGLLAASSGLLVVAALLPGTPAAAEAPAGWPAADWAASCADADAQFCIDSATLTPIGGVVTPLADLDLTAVAATRPDEYVNWLTWSVQGWADQPEEVIGGEINLVIRTGPVAPRVTSAVAAGLRVSRGEDGQGNYSLIVSGRATHVDWTTGPNAEDCADLQYCGEYDDMADEAGTGFRFEGKTQNLTGGSPGAFDAIDGAYIASNAQAHTEDIGYGTDEDPYLWLGVLGNPQLDLNGDPVRNFVTAWVPDAYFTEIGTTATAALAVGFDPVSTTDGMTGSVPATASASDGGVRFEIPDIANGAAAGELRVFHRAARAGVGDGAPGVARDVTVSGAQDALTVSWQAPESDGGTPVAGYRARAFSAQTGGPVVSRCDGEVETMSCTIYGLADGETYYVAVAAYGPLGEGRSTSRAAAVAGAPPANPPSEPRLVRVTPGPNRIAVSWSAPESDGGAPVDIYAVRAYRAVRGGVQVTDCEALAPRRTCTLTGLPKGTKVYIGVTATNIAGDGPESARPSATAWTAAGPVRKLAAKSAKSRITVSWQAPAATGGTAITGYRADLYAKVRGGSPAARCTAAAKALTCKTGLLKPGRTYYVSVTALNAAGSSAQPARVKILVRR